MFNLFKRKKKKDELTDSQRKWNKMWELWVDGNVDSPYGEIMTYQSEINNGGHSQYFCNTDNTGDLKKEMAELYKLLPANFKDNLKRAYEAHLKYEQNEDDEEAEAILEECDSFFYDNEQIIIDMLEKYSEEHFEV